MLPLLALTARLAFRIIESATDVDFELNDPGWE